MKKYMERYTALNKLDYTKSDIGIAALAKILTKIERHFNSPDRWTKDIYSDPQIIYRGISKDYEGCSLKNRDWFIRSSLSVRFRNTIKELYWNNDKKNIENTNSEERLKQLDELDKLYQKHIKKADYINQILTLISDAKRSYPDRYYKKHDLEILADIQHNGGATCLVDFSKNILTSLWFACSRDLNADGFLVCYNTTEDLIINNSLTKLTEEDIKKPIRELLTKTYRLVDACSVVNNRFCLWEPMSVNNRISRQDSVFLFGIEQFKISKMSNSTVMLITIPKELKKPICNLLESRFAINSMNIFNDCNGFASSNEKLNILYREKKELNQKGLNALLHGNYKEALSLYNSDYAIELVANTSNAEKIELYFSKAVCYKNRGDNYYNNAILYYDKVIEFAPTLLKNSNQFKQSIYYIRKVMRAYNEIINIYYKTQNWEKGINTCDRIIEFITQNTKKEIPELNIRIAILIKIEFLILRQLSNYTNFRNKSIRTFIENANKQLNEVKLKLFDQFLIECYSIIVSTLKQGKYNTHSIEDKFQKCLNEIKEQENAEKQENDLLGFYSWNFEDIKQAIDKIPEEKKQIQKTKSALKQLIAEIIAYKDIIQSSTYSLYYKI